MVTEIKKFNVDTDYTKLEVADYVIGDDWAWERKAMSDFIRSLHSGKIWKDLRAIRDNYKYPGLILEGKLPTVYPRSAYYLLKRLRATLGSIRYDWKVPIDRTDSIKDTAMFLVSIHSRIGKEKKAWYRPVKKKAVHPFEIASDLLCTLPKIGRVKAETMLMEHGTIKNVINLSAEDLRKFKGVSKDNADRIYSILNLKMKKE
jgi:ERCC4-type nuclease